MEIFITIVMITLLILVHECGHYLAAKHYGFLTPVFGIGMPFGPFIEIFERWGTKFRFYFALIGGFVAIPELGDETDQEMLDQFDIKQEDLRPFPVFPRMVVASGGIVFNILFAFILAVFMAATVGLPKGVPNNEIIDFVNEESVAKKAGFVIGDRVIKINTTEIATSEDIKENLAKYQGEVITVLVQRPETEESAEQKLTFEFFNEGKLGVVLGQDKVYEQFKFNPFVWVWKGFVFTMKTLFFMFLSVGGIMMAFFYKIVNFINPGMIENTTDLNQVKGIVGIVELISHDIHSNYMLIFEFAILLSLNLAIINVLPIPGLDGGHLMFMLWEAITGTKIPDEFMRYAMQVGFAFLLFIILLTTFNDIKNWIIG